MLASHDVAYALNESHPNPAARHLVENGIRYEHAEGFTRDYAKAHALYCEAARLDSVDAFLRMGWMYANGRGIQRDDAIASTLFRRAAALGSDMGARLGQLIRGDGDKLPACLQPVAIAEPPPAPESEALVAPPPEPIVDYGPTPAIEAPAEFRAAPASIDRRKLAQTVVQMAREFRLDPRLVFAVMQAESNFNPQARSTKNAQGLMQLIPETAERFAVRDAFDPIENLRGGMSYLRWLLSYFRGDVVLTLAGYNAGEGAVDKYRGVPPFAETLAYVQRIRALYPHDRHAFDNRVAPPSWISQRQAGESRPQARQARPERAG
ncbi:MAG: transglycosylase SLT domain-containing protein [Burkholderiaceae bacterium]